MLYVLAGDTKLLGPPQGTSSPSASRCMCFIFAASPGLPSALRGMRRWALVDAVHTVHLDQVEKRPA